MNEQHIHLHIYNPHRDPSVKKIILFEQSCNVLPLLLLTCISQFCYGNKQLLTTFVSGSLYIRMLRQLQVGHSSANIGWSHLGSTCLLILEPRLRE